VSLDPGRKKPAICDGLKSGRKRRMPTAELNLR
jgi:hypothetical protein